MSLPNDDGFLGECEQCEKYRIVKFDERLEIYMCRTCVLLVDEDDEPCQES